MRALSPRVIAGPVPAIHVEPAPNSTSMVFFAESPHWCPGQARAWRRAWGAAAEI